MEGLPPLARNAANPISAPRSQTPVRSLHRFRPSLLFQNADKGQIIIDRVELSRFELKRGALPPFNPYLSVRTVQSDLLSPMFGFPLSFSPDE